MSSDFFFRKWKTTLSNLEDLVKLDIIYQETKAHDKRRCEASNRLAGMLGEYMSIYNEALECLHQNLQIQKTKYLEEVVKAVVSRILELKHELRKLDASDYQFLSNGLAYHKLSTFDAELLDIPSKIQRPEHMQIVIDEIIERARKKKSELVIAEEEEIEQPVSEKLNAWWDADSKETIEDAKVEAEVEMSEETLEMKRMITLIQAHEKSRQVISWLRKQTLRREKWLKELNGTLRPQARYEIRERSAELIQKVLRAYFELKRHKYKECKRSELLGLMVCDKLNTAEQEKAEQIKLSRSQLTKKYTNQLITLTEETKKLFMKRKGDEISENYRDYVRSWFRQWFDEIQYFHDIPEESQGGAVLIFKDELPAPLEWLEKYKTYMEQKIAIKNKTSLELKFAKMEAKREEMMLKKEELMKKKLEQELMKKIMKNPSLHPGFNYPESKKTEHILKVLEHYHKDWDYLDSLDTIDVKEIVLSNAYMEAKMEIVATVDEDMKNELKALKIALKDDYKANDEKMPEPMKTPKKKQKKKHRVKATISEHVAGKMEDLVLRGFIKEYPKTKLDEFLGDPNFAGSDIRCQYKHAPPYHGETRGIWWERCRELIHGFHRILLVGPHGSGKTTLIHALASVNDAVLFEIDPAQFPREILSAAYLQQLVLSVASCAKASQPSVIHIKHVQRLYYSKVWVQTIRGRVEDIVCPPNPYLTAPPEDGDLNLDFIKNFIIRKLFKRIHKTDKITIIGSCVDPWTTKSKQMLKQFPTVVLMPNTSYSIVVEMLKNWVISNNVIPSDFEVNSLAYVLQGYSFSYLKQMIENFLSPQRIVQIASRGISPQEIYNYILEDDAGVKVDYAKYEKWYTEKTQSGKKEKKHLEEQKEFKQTMDRWAEKMKNKKQASIKQSF